MTDFAKLDQLVGQGFLTKSELGELVLYNYTDDCSFQKFWPPECLQNRGTIYNKVTGEIVARPYDKFFNLGEHDSTRLLNLPIVPFEIAEKEDGSMGTVFHYDGAWRVATRGSFKSDQAIRATRMLNNNWGPLEPIGSSKVVDHWPRYNMDFWPKEWTPIVEIIFPENRIASKLVVDYGDRETLILTGARHIQTGVLMNRHRLYHLAAYCGFDVPQTYNLSIDEMLDQVETLDRNHEGWVLTYANGLMVKIKGKRYLEIARFMAHVNPISIWEQMKAGTALEFITSAPEEVRHDAQEMCDKLTGQLQRLFSACAALAMLMELNNVNSAEKRKRKAEEIMKQPEWMRGFLFMCMHARDADTCEETLYNHIRPKGGQYVDLSKFGVK